MTSTKYKYLIVESDAGGSWELFGTKSREDLDDPRKCNLLPGLLDEGWIPVRETPFNDVNRGLLTRRSTHILVLLQKD